MIRILLKRIAMLPLVTLGVTFLLFSLTHILPAEMRASIYIQDQRQLNPETVRNIIKEHGLNDPLPVQYARWMRQILRGELGYSETAKMPVSKAIKSFLPATLELSVATIIPVFFLGI
ncbi:MAG: ABC transporter permease, partial [bacterium]